MKFGVGLCCGTERNFGVILLSCSYVSLVLFLLSKQNCWRYLRDSRNFIQLIGLYQNVLWCLSNDIAIFSCRVLEWKLLLVMGIDRKCRKGQWRTNVQDMKIKDMILSDKSAKDDIAGHDIGGQSSFQIFQQVVVYFSRSYRSPR